MKKKADLVRGWLRKARSDELAMTASLNAGALDVCCFHAQQAAERFLKAYLIHTDTDFPFTHNLVKLIELAARTDHEFRGLSAEGELLTPYAVELRYDEDFWPSREVAEQACASATTVRDLVTARLPKDIARPG